VRRDTEENTILYYRYNMNTQWNTTMYIYYCCSYIYNNLTTISPHFDNNLLICNIIISENMATLKWVLLYSFLAHLLVLHVQSKEKIATMHNPPSVLIFTSWDYRFKAVIDKRLRHHKAYANRHGYAYRIYVPAGHEYKVNKTDVDVAAVTIPPVAVGTNYRAGWFKVFVYLELLKSNAYDYLFYLDVDVVFHNFEWPILDVLKGYDQSIFLQLSQPADPKGVMNMQTSSHVVILRNTDASRTFVQKWFEMKTPCPEINMEMGAMFGAVAELYSDYKIEFPCKKSICPKDMARKNGNFGDCFNSFMINNFGPNPIHKDIHIFRFTTDKPKPPLDGFSAETFYVDPKLSCPLTLHPFKKFTDDYTPIYTKCSSLKS
jgi:hypothetical protein